jgi:hypothetical protein
MRRGTHRALLYKRPAVVAASGYEGPGDIVSGASHHYGVYAYDAAYATGSNPCMDLVDQADGNPITVNIATDGIIDIAAIATWVTANSVTTIRIEKIYDQIDTDHLLRGSDVANFPELKLNASGSVPSIRNPAEDRYIISSTGITSIAQPFTIMGVAKRVSGANAFSPPFGNTSEGQVHFWNDSQLILTGGSVVSATGTTTSENVFLTMGGLFSGASSKGIIDGTVGSSVDAGSDAADGQNIIFPSANTLNGEVMGWTLWPSDVTASAAALHAANETNLGI